MREQRTWRLVLRSGAVASVLLLGFCLAETSRAQPRPGVPARAAFKVASVKRHSFAGSFSGRGFSISGPRVTVRAISVMEIIMRAYDVKMYQVVGGPDWMAGRGLEYLYDIDAKAEGDDAPTSEQVRQMFQTLLAERFELRVHRENRDMPVFALRVAAKGPKLNGSAADTPSTTFRPGASVNRLTVAKATMTQLALSLSSFAGRPVFDETGLTGTYDYQLEWLREQPLGPVGAKAPDADAPPLVTALREQLGLKLEPERRSMEVLAVDHLAMPSEN